MAAETDDFSVDLPEPGWKERIGAVRRAARALASTRAEIFREELAEKGSLFGQGLAGVGLALAFALLSLVLLAALVAAVLAKLLGSAIAGLAVALLLYLIVAAAAALFGVKRLSRVRPLEFPATRDELRKDLDAVREEPSGAGDEAAGIARPDVLAAERASVRPGGRHEGERSVAEDLEDRFRAGSE